ncbi:MAG: hypothetical protein JXQ90_17425 [Cyclobacteriaceae bacterium]
MKFIVSSLFTLIIFRAHAQSIQLVEQTSGTAQLLIAQHILDEQTVWASGTGGTVIFTENGGEQWSIYTHPMDTMQFRDVYGLSSDMAMLLSIGSGKASAIFKFTRSKNAFELLYQMDDPNGFLDCMDFWDDKRGVVYGDAIGEQPYILVTRDGGQTWNFPTGNMPQAGNGEGGFASSGTCVELGGNGQAWIGTGAGGNARLLYSGDYGNSWSALVTPMIKGEAAGITSVRFTDDQSGLIVGGDLMNDSTTQSNYFLTQDGGTNWTSGIDPITVGAFYCSAFANVNGSNVSIICGPKGADVIFNNGLTIENISDKNLWTAELLPSGIGWLMGRNGTVIKIGID